MADKDKIIVRKAEARDLDAMVDVWWQMVSEHEGRDPDYWRNLPEAESRKRFRDWKEKLITQENHFHLVAEIHGKVAGFIYGHVLERPRVMKTSPIGRVDEVAVDREFRGQGAGQAMLSALAEELRKQGLPLVELMVDTDNPVAQALYEKAGFYIRQQQMIKKL